MASMEPFSRLIGPCKVYIAPTGEAASAVNATPAGNWVRLGVTDGGQKVKHSGELEYFTDDDHSSDVMATRPHEVHEVEMTVVGLDMNTYARLLDRVADIVTAGGPPATSKIPLKRGHTPYEYALLLKGEARSPFGALPGQYWIPRCVIDGEFEVDHQKEESAGIEIIFHALEDDDQTEADRLGYLIVQSA
jgi:hypothetical protein